MLPSHPHVKSNLYHDPRKAVFAELSGTRLPRGSYGVYVAITGFAWSLFEGCHVYHVIATYIL